MRFNVTKNLIYPSNSLQGKYWCLQGWHRPLLAGHCQSHLRIFRNAEGHLRGQHRHLFQVADQCAECSAFLVNLINKLYAWSGRCQPCRHQYFPCKAPSWTRSSQFRSQPEWSSGQRVWRQPDILFTSANYYYRGIAAFNRNTPKKSSKHFFVQ